MRDYQRLIDEAEQAPIVGWDFSWLRDRATEDRPSWAYSRLAASRLAEASAALDVDTGGGETLASLARFPPLMAATESWPPNVAIAGRRLRPLGVHVVQTDNSSVLPFADGSFHMVINRHGTRGRSESADALAWWREVARVIRPGGHLLSQQVGGRTMAELRQVMGAQTTRSRPSWGPAMARAVLERAGFVVTDAREEFLKTVFLDVGAVVYYLRLVIWILPDFTVARYAPALARLHDSIEAHGPFVTHAHRFLIDARVAKP